LIQKLRRNRLYKEEKNDKNVRNRGGVFENNPFSSVFFNI